jgi:TolB-like protein/tetratricopeptide (TPR) repeat protein
MLAVLPFENLTGDSSQEYFSDGVTEELIAELGSLDPQHLGVIARTSVMHYKGSGVPLDQIGRELGVQYVIEGSVRRDSQRFRITAQLIQVRDQTHLWAKEFDREPVAVLTVQDEIARAVSSEILRTVGNGQKTDIPASRGVTAASYEAFDLYLKGRFFGNKRTIEGFRQAAGYFQQAISKDPDYARAYAGLADTYSLMSTWNLVDQNEFMPKARAAALKALDIDDTLAEAHTSLALSAESYQYDWKGAEKEFRRAIQLNPDYATAHQWYAELLSWEGRFDEAFAESERARQLDPLSLIIASDHGAILYFSRQYDRTVTHCKAVLAMDPHASRCSAFLLYSLVELRRFPEALDLLQQRHLAPDGAWALAQRAYFLGRRGRTAEARAVLERLKRDKASMDFDRSPALLLPTRVSGPKIKRSPCWRKLTPNIPIPSSH